MREEGAVVKIGDGRIEMEALDFANWMPFCIGLEFSISIGNLESLKIFNRDRIGPIDQAVGSKLEIE